MLPSLSFHSEALAISLRYTVIFWLVESLSQDSFEFAAVRRLNQRNDLVSLTGEAPPLFVQLTAQL